MFIFAGKDEENNKLNDLWMFNFNDYIWSQIEPESNNVPLSRSGHSCTMYNDYLIVFGGIHEVTKELDDV
jgi:N-acetylneuraminic acid mutarotase